MSKPLTIGQFLKEFPDDDACLAHLFKVRYGDNPKCERCGETGKFRKLAKLPAYTCNCGNHVHPMVGTPFHRSRTPLQKWFFAMFLFSTTRNGVAAKELQRQLGVTYKTAWRIARLIREYMGWVDGDAPLGVQVVRSSKPTKLISAAGTSKGMMTRPSFSVWSSGVARPLPTSFLIAVNLPQLRCSKNLCVPVRALRLTNLRATKILDWKGSPTVASITRPRNMCAANGTPTPLRASGRW